MCITTFIWRVLLLSYGVYYYFRIAYSVWITHVCMSVCITCVCIIECTSEIVCLCVLPVCASLSVHQRSIFCMSVCITCVCIIECTSEIDILFLKAVQHDCSWFAAIHYALYHQARWYLVQYRDGAGPAPLIPYILFYFQSIRTSLFHHHQLATVDMHV